MTRLENFMLGLAKSVASIKGSELSFRIKNYSISTKFVKPRNTDSRLWEDHYESGNIYIGDSANPVKIRPDNKESEDYEIISTDYFKTFMQNQAISEAFNTGGQGIGQTAKLVILNIIVTAMVALIVVGVLAG